MPDEQRDLRILVLSEGRYDLVIHIPSEFLKIDEDANTWSLAGEDVTFVIGSDFRRPDRALRTLQVIGVYDFSDPTHSNNCVNHLYKVQ